MNYSTILFDFDGTLADPKYGIINSIAYALSQYGIHIDNLDDLKSWIGPPLHLSFQELRPDLFNGDELDKVVEHHRAFFREKGKYEYVLYPGIMDLLKELTSRGNQLIIATSKATVVAEDLAKILKIDSYFHHIQGSNLDGTRSAKDEIIEEVWRVLGKPEKKDLVMIGDRHHDIEGAQKKNVDSIGVLWGYGSKDELEQVNATYLVNSPEELGRLLSSSMVG